MMLSMAVIPIIISIHALLAESDPGKSQASSSRDWYFYPRSPCGERQPSTTSEIDKHDNFYPRSPCGERRVHYGDYNLHCTISIHALLAESDFGRAFWPGLSL